MPRERQSSKGDNSPNIGGDYRPYREGDSTYFSFDMTDIVREWHKYKQQAAVLKRKLSDLEAQGRKLESARDRLSSHRDRLLVVAVLAIVITVILAISLINTERQAANSNANPASLEASDTAKSQAIETLRTIPPIRPIPCASNKWITQLGTTLSTDDGKGDMQDRLIALRVRATRSLELNVAPTVQSCSNFSRSNYLIVYAGPFASPAEALDVCHSFGWTSNSDYDRNKCLVVSLDSTSELRYFYPDGSGHKSSGG